MKFIFPQNYNFKPKLLGILDYNTIFLNIIWDLIIFLITFLFNNINIKIVVFLIFSFPMFLFSFSGFNGENIIIMLSYIIKYFFSKKIYFFDKRSNYYNSFNKY